MIFSFCSCASPLIRRPPSYILTLMITRFVSDRLNKLDSALALPKRPAILAPLSFLAPNFSGTGLFAALGLPPVIVNGSSSSSIFWLDRVYYSPALLVRIVDMAAGVLENRPVIP